MFEYIWKFLLTLDYTWVVTLVALIGAIANIYKKRWGFALWVASNGYWCFYNYRLELYPQAAQYLVFLLVSAYGLFLWIEEPRKKRPIASKYRNHQNSKEDL